MVPKRYSRYILTTLSTFFTLGLFISLSFVYMEHFPFVLGASPSSLERTKQIESDKRFHIVKNGETLADISKKYYGSPKYIETICEANHLMTTTDPEPGDNLMIPAFP